MQADEMARRLRILAQTFTPSAPIQDQKIFAGRIGQVNECAGLTSQPGAHGILYGERGVGKTSIANIMQLVWKGSGRNVCKTSCSTTDTYATVWQKLFQDLRVEQSQTIRKIGFRQQETVKKGTTPLSALLGDFTYSPENVLGILRQLQMPLIVILDEFDRLGVKFDRAAFADTLKYISDTMAGITFLIVGVGDNVTELIGEHASIERNLKQIHLPIMNPEELSEIIDKGIGQAGMTMDTTVKRSIVEYSCGYPHYTHLLTLNACRKAVRSDRLDVRPTDFDEAIRIALAESHESLRAAAQKATLANKDNIFKQVLWACSAVPTDEHGTFQPHDLSVPLSRILGRETKVTQFAYHLSKLCSEERGNILIALGAPKRRRYKFKNPLMRAYVRMNMYAAKTPAG